MSTSELQVPIRDMVDNVNFHWTQGFNPFSTTYLTQDDSVILEVNPTLELKMSKTSTIFQTTSYRKSPRPLRPRHHPRYRPTASPHRRAPTRPNSSSNRTAAATTTWTTFGGTARRLRGSRSGGWRRSSSRRTTSRGRRGASWPQSSICQKTPSR